MKPKVIFFGQDWRSALILKGLLKAQFEVMTVVTLPDKPGGRKKQILPNPVKTLAQKQQIPLLELAAAIRIKYKNPEAGILASFGAIISLEILSLFPKGILVVHPSLLPKHRGPKPVVGTLLAGDKKTGVTIFKMDEKIDHGPIISQCKEEIRSDDTTASLEKRLFQTAAEVLPNILSAYLENRIETRTQNEKQATYTKKLTRAEGQINWAGEDSEIERFIRAMTPWPGAWTKISLTSTIPDRKPESIQDRKKLKRLKILKAHLENKRLALDQVQLEGKNPVSWKQFQEGYPQAKIIKKI